MSFLGRIGAALSPSPANLSGDQGGGAANNSNMQFGTQPNGANAPNPNPATLPGTAPTGPNANTPSEPVDPFDKYKGMFDTKANTDVAPNFTLDEKMLGDAAGQQDFLKGISPELVQKATSGDTTALMQMINEAGRNAYKAALSHSGRLTESFVGAREGYQDRGFSKRVRGEMTVNALTQTPNFKNPVVREQLTRIANDLQAQHPDAAPGEIADMAKDYIMQLSSAIATPVASTEADKRSRAPVDFGEWFANDKG